MKKNIDPSAMRISFDLDEVLFVSPATHRVEPALPFPYNKIYKERLRLGTVELIHALQDRGYSVWVYTTSFRRTEYISGLFKRYGIRFDDIVNGYRHSKEVQADNPYRLPSKLPSKYRIALHIDDDRSVRENGIAYGFKVYQLFEQDDEWVGKILECADSVYRRWKDQ